MLASSLLYLGLYKVLHVSLIMVLLLTELLPRRAERRIEKGTGTYRTLTIRMCRLQELIGY